MSLLMTPAVRNPDSTQRSLLFPRYKDECTLSEKKVVGNVVVIGLVEDWSILGGWEVQGQNLRIRRN